MAQRLGPLLVIAILFAPLRALWWDDAVPKAARTRRVPVNDEGGSGGPGASREPMRPRVCWWATTWWDQVECGYTSLSCLSLSYDLPPSDVESCLGFERLRCRQEDGR